MPTPPNAESQDSAEEMPAEQFEMLSQPEPAPKKAEPVKVNKSLNVIATRSGYYKQSRKVEGDKFTIDGEHQLGTWMKII